jgi:hypothetical protein
MANKMLAINAKQAALDAALAEAHDRALLTRFAPEQVPAWDLSHGPAARNGNLTVPAVSRTVIATRVATEVLKERGYTPYKYHRFSDTLVVTMTTEQTDRARALTSLPGVKDVRVGFVYTDEPEKWLPAANVAVCPWRTDDFVAYVVVLL